MEVDSDFDERSIMLAKKIEIAEKSDKLRQLILDNPDLPIVIVTDSEVVADDGYVWWYGSSIDYSIKTLIQYENYYDEFRLIDDIRDLEEAISNDMTYEERYENLSDNEFNKIVNDKVKECEPLWTKCIVIYSTT